MYGDGSRADLTSDGKPLPTIMPLNEKFWGASASVSIFPANLQCLRPSTRGRNRRFCPRCLSTDQDWLPASGEGILESWVDFHRAYWDGFKAELPYRVCLVRLKEGPLFVSNLMVPGRNCAPALPVRVAFTKVTEDITLPRFTLSEGRAFAAAPRAPYPPASQTRAPYSSGTRRRETEK